MKKKLKSVLKRIVFAYLVIAVSMWLFQRHIIFVPDTNIAEPSVYGLSDFAVVPLTSADGTHVQAWYHEAKPGYPTIVHFHGNGGDLADRSPYFRLLSDEGFGVMGLDYRGYGKSEGRPSEQGFYLDARATMDYCLKQLSLPVSRLVIYGESIGTGVAVQMATEYPAAGLVLQSPFTSLLTLGQDSYPWLPVSLLQIDRFDSLSKIANIHSPLLLIHGGKDPIVPFSHGQAIFAAAPEPKEALYYPDKGHVNLDIGLMSKAVLAFSEKNKLITQPQ